MQEPSIYSYGLHQAGCDSVLIKCWIKLVCRIFALSVLRLACPLKQFGLFVIISLGLLLLSRIGLMWWQAERVNDVSGWQLNVAQEERSFVVAIDLDVSNAAAY
ncbi:MAG: hypothetical protein GY814_20730 [Gammaproteobacteria bacterium]|nr:hypothetical protein [Gammaproteobacteria bacterium]